MKNEIKSGAILGYLNIFATIIVTLVYTPIMLNLVGKSEYGLYSLVSSITMYLSVLDMGFGNAMIRFSSKSQAKGEDDSKINGMFLLLYIIIGIVAFIIGIIMVINVDAIFSASLTESELNKAKLLMFIMVLNIALTFPLSTFTSYAMAHEKFKFLKLLALLKTIATPVFTLPLLMIGYKSVAMVLVAVLVSLSINVMIMIYSLLKLRMKIDFKLKSFDTGLFKEISVYSFYIFLNLIVDQIYRNTDQVILGAVSGTIVVTIYSLASQINQMNTLFSTAISGLFLPKITKTLETKDADKKLSNIFIKVSRLQIYVLLLFLTGFIIFGNTFITLWVGNDYIDVYYIVLLLITPSIVPLTQNICISIIQAKNKHKFRSIVYIFVAVLNIIISIPLAKTWGGIGAAIGTALATILGQIIVMNIYYYKVINIDIPTYWKNFTKILLPILIVSIILKYLIANITLGWIKLFIFACIYGIIYLIYIYLLLDKDEKIYINGIIKKVFKA